jgi:hypothetical protein
MLADTSFSKTLRERQCAMKPMPTTRGMAASLKRLSRKSHLGLQHSYERTAGAAIGPIRCGGRPFRSSL